MQVVEDSRLNGKKKGAQNWAKNRLFLPDRTVDWAEVAKKRKSCSVLVIDGAKCGQIAHRYVGPLGYCLDHLAEAFTKQEETWRKRPLRVPVNVW